MKIITFIGLFIMPLLVTGQTYYEFPKDSATWSICAYTPFTTSSYKCDSVSHYGMFGDTLIQGKVYSKFYGYSEGGINLNENNPGFMMDQAAYLGAFRNDDSQKVYFWSANSNAEYLMFDFGLNVGDSFTFQYPDGTPSDVQTVISIDSQLINNNQYRRKISFSLGYTWVEGIGNWTYNFFGALGWPLGFYCHTNKGEQLIGVAGRCSCNQDEVITYDNHLIVAIKDVALQTHNFEIYPNPSSKDVHISMSDVVADCTITVYDIVGTEIHKEQKKNSNFANINMSQYASGSYVITVETGRGIISKVLIIQ